MKDVPQMPMPARRQAGLSSSVSGTRWALVASLAWTKASDSGSRNHWMAATTRPAT